MRGSWIALLSAGLLAAGTGAQAARADGLPVLGIDVGGSGVAAAGSDARLVTMPAGVDTVVARVTRAGGRVVLSRLLHGMFTIPAVAYDSSAGGLSADGKTLVLIEPRLGFPRAQTTLLPMDARRLSPGRPIRLQGDFSLDAVSPHGRWLYLIQYTSPSNPNRYRVRAYDLRTRRLLAEPVTDPHNRGEQMAGRPLSRASSADGRWAYTLYDGGGKTPFIHALDTIKRAARCIDLDRLSRIDLSNARLSTNDTTVIIRNGGEPLLTVDRSTFAVRTL